MAKRKSKERTYSEAERIYWYEKGLREGKEQVVDELVNLLGLPERFADQDHSHWRENEDN